MLARLTGLVMAVALVVTACAPRALPREQSGAASLLSPPPAPLSPVDGGLSVLRGPIPWPFEANGGQGPADAPLLLKHDPFTAAFTATGPRLRVFGPDPDAEQPVATEGSPWGAPGLHEAARPQLRAATLDLELVGARPVQPVGTVPAEARISYLKGDLWAPDLPSYHQIAYREGWAGVELRYERDARGLKSTYVVAPGADPSVIALAWRGADAVRLAEDGALEIATAAGTLRETAPVAWQDGPDGARQPVAACWAEVGTDADGGPAWGFALGVYDPARPLVIDPVLYGTYLGGSGSVPNAGSGYDWAAGVTVDASGRAIVAGESRSVDFGFGGAPGFDHSFNDNCCGDVFVVRLNPSGTALEYGTYLGGADYDFARGVALDSGERAVVVGGTISADFGFGGAPGFDQSHNAAEDGFAVRLNASGTALEYGTYLGGVNQDSATSVAVDRNGRATVAGWTFSPTFGFGGAPGFDQSHNGAEDGFVVRLDPAGTGLEYGTFLGSSGHDYADAVAIDAVGRAVVVGQAWSADFGFGGAPGFDQSYNGGIMDAFVVRLNAAGTALEYGTFLGGSDGDRATGVAIDAGGRIVVAGSGSPDFGFGGAPGLDQSAMPGGFVVRLNVTGTGLEYGAGLRGNPNAVAVDVDGRAILVGTTGPTLNFGGAPGFDQTFNGGGLDAFMMRLSPAGTVLEYGTYLGGTDSEHGNDVAVDAGGRAFVVGATWSRDFGFGGAPGFDQSYNGGFGDTFVVHDSPAGAVVAPVAELVTTESSGVATFTIRLISAPTADVTIRLSSSDTTEGTVSRASLTFTPANALTPQTVTVTGMDDELIDGAVRYTIVTAPAVSADPVYSGTNPADVAVTNADNERVPRRPAFDFNGDGRADPAIRRLGAGPQGQALWWPRDVPGFPVPFPDQAGAVPVPADYDGDGKADVAFYRPSGGLWFGQKSSDGRLGPWYILGGQSDDIPIPCDYDGDGKADPAYFRPSTGQWFGLNTDGNQVRLNSNVTFGPLGRPGDVPVVGDYDGDGRCDVGIFRPADGLWFGLRPTDGTIVLDSRTNIGQFGERGDIAVPGDYDGDGRTDLAYYRPSSTLWFGLRTNGTIALTGVRYGGHESIPVPADYDGDGRTDIAFYDPPTGRIIARPSAGGASIVKDFGMAPGDVPVGKRPALPGYPY